MTLNGRPTSFHQNQVGGTNGVEVTSSIKGDADVTVEYDGGVGIVPPSANPLIGNRTTSLKVMSIRVTSPNRLDLVVAGLAGGSNTLDLVTTLNVSADGAEVRKTAAGCQLVIPFKSTDYATRVVGVTLGPR